MGETGSLEPSIETGLSNLINLSGKLRMLSHRAVMFAALGAADTETAFSAEITAALDEFARIVNAIKSGDLDLGVTETSIAYLQDKGGGSPETLAPIDAFVARSDALRGGRRLDLEALREIAAFVAGDLLGALNTLNGEVRDALAQRTEDQKLARKDSRSVIASATYQLRTISRTAQALSINAVLESKRLGQDGAAMQQVAQEMVRLTDEVGGLATEIDGFFKSIGA